MSHPLYSRGHAAAPAGAAGARPAPLDQAPRLARGTPLRLAAIALALASALAAPPAPGQQPAAAEGLSPEAALASFRIAAGFRIELVAAEPLVADPVGIAWDEKGRLWVAEMSDYPTGADGGRIRILEDADADGRPERSVIFAEKLSFPTSVLPFRRGALVSSAPDILYLEDADGDGRADARSAVLTGFQPGNTQLRVNGLLWGIDGRIYGANGRSGGKVRRPGDGPESAIDISGSDFRFDRESFQPEAIAGRSQFGHGFDDWGRRYLSWNTVHIRQEILSPRDLERHPRLLRTETAASISDHGDSARIYALVPPPRTYNNEPTDHFNASCGLTVERGGSFPAADAGNAFVCEPLVGLVHRDRLLEGQGPARIARRGETEREFLASTDTWFHPVNLRSGPDGALYVVDFYRDTVEHPEYVRAELRGGIDFTRGRGHGRLWRIVPAAGDLLPVEDLGRLGAAALVARLRSPNGQARDSAQRLVLERRDPECLAPLAALARGEAEPAVARATALWTLQALGALDEALLAGTLAAADPRLQETAIRIAREKGVVRGAIAGAVIERAASLDPLVRLHAVLALGDWREPGRERLTAAALAGAARRGRGDPWLAAAVSSSVLGCETEFLEIAALDPAVADDLVREIAELAGAAGGDATPLVELALRAIELGRLDRALALGGGLAAGLSRGGRSLRAGEPPPAWLQFFAAAAGAARAARAPVSRRAAAAAVLAHAPYDIGGAALGSCLDVAADLEVQRAAARALAAHDLPAAAAALLRFWPRASPAVRAAIADAAARRPAHRAALAAALVEGSVSPRDLGQAERDAFLRALEPDARARMEELLRRSDADRAAVIERYRERALAPGDAARGEAVYLNTCSGCHRFGGKGNAVGPDLAGSGKKSREDLLVSLLDPNRSAVPGYVAYTVVTRGGETATGILAGETREAVTLRRAGGLEDTVRRADIVELSASGVSLMPEGLEETLSPADFADLLEYLRSG